MNDAQVTRLKINELEEVVNKFDGLMAEAINQKLVAAYDYKNVVAMMTGKTIVTMREIICLIKAGFPDGALSLARNLYEQMVVIVFFENHQHDTDFQEYIDDYYTDYEVQRYRALIYEAEHCRMDVIQKDALEKERDEAKKSSHKKVTGGDYWWTGKGTFKKLEDEMMELQQDEQHQKFFAILHLMYLRACISLHASSIGNQLRLGNDLEFDGIDTGPTNQGYEIPLCLAATSMIMLVSISCKVFGVSSDELTNKLNELALLYSVPQAKNKKIS